MVATGSYSQPSASHVSRKRSRTSTQPQKREDSDDEGEENVHTHKGLTEEEVETLAASVVGCILGKHNAKGGVKESEAKRLLKDVLPFTRRSETFDHAKRLLSLFGLEYHTAENGRIILVNALEKKGNQPSPFDPLANLSDQEKITYGVLSATLTYILMARQPADVTGTVSEKQLTDFLKGILTPPFIDKSKIVAEFASRGWIEAVKSSNPSEVALLNYKWGQRAALQFDAKALLDKFCELDGSDPRSWKRAYEGVRAERGNPQH